jgi:hypothetical protein
MLWARLRTALLTNALASVAVGRASDRTSLWTTRLKPKPSMPKPWHTTFPSRNRSLSEAAARSLVPKAIALASATNAVGPGVVDEDVVASAVLVLLCWLQPVLGSARTPSRRTGFISQWTIARIVSPPLAALSALKRQRAQHRYSDVPVNLTGEWRALLTGIAGYQRNCRVQRWHATPCSQSQIGWTRHLRRQGTAQVRAAGVLSVGVRSGPVTTALKMTR